jgi:hypothetical protein
MHGPQISEQKACATNHANTNRSTIYEPVFAHILIFKFSGIYLNFSLILKTPSISLCKFLAYVY